MQLGEVLAEIIRRGSQGDSSEGGWLSWLAYSFRLDAGPIGEALAAILHYEVTLQDRSHR